MLYIIFIDRIIRSKFNNDRDIAREVLEKGGSLIYIYALAGG